MPVDPIERLAANARRRSEQTLQKAQDAITVMTARGDAITVARLAMNAQVSRSWIYMQPELRERIEQLCQAAPARPPRSAAASRASLDSLSTACTWPTSASVNYVRRTSSFGDRSSSCTGNSGTAGLGCTAVAGMKPPVKDSCPRRDVQATRHIGSRRTAVAFSTRDEITTDGGTRI